MSAIAHSLQPKYNGAIAAQRYWTVNFGLNSDRVAGFYSSQPSRLKITAQRPLGPLRSHSA